VLDVVVFLFLAGLWFIGAIINGPNFHPNLTLEAPTIGYSISCCVSCWLAQQDSVDGSTGPARRCPAASHNNYSNAPILPSTIIILFYFLSSVGVVKWNKMLKYQFFKVVCILKISWGT